MRISVVIPALNETGHIDKAILSAQGAGVGGAFEVIVVDGGSSDGTADIAASLGARILITGPGRAAQMNAGAKAASGDVLLFLHADTTLPADYAGQILKALESKNIAAGAFTMEIDSPGLGLRVIERLANWRARWLKMPYGDQAIFVRADAFRAVGGFPDMPLMEDFEFIRRIRKIGEVTLLPARVMTSPRRWLEKGILRMTLIHQAIILGYFMGVSHGRMAGWRRGKRG